MPNKHKRKATVPQDTVESSAQTSDLKAPAVKILRFSKSISAPNPVAAEPKIQPGITELGTFGDIKAYLIPGALIVLDLDNNVEETTTELGSDQWFRAYMKRETERLGDAKAAATKTVEIYNRVHSVAKVQPVEANIPDLIKEWQKEYDVVALTTRGLEIAGATVRQLAEIGVDFNHGRFKHLVINLNQGSSSQAQNGIIFCGGKPKDVCFTEFLNQLKHMEWTPSRIICSDDHGYNVERVKLTADQFGIPYYGFRYGRLDEKVKQVNLAVTDVQLSVLGNIISTEEAQLLYQFRQQRALKDRDEAAVNLVSVGNSGSAQKLQL